jgi:hypothetical protein
MPEPGVRLHKPESMRGSAYIYTNLNVVSTKAKQCNLSVLDKGLISLKSQRLCRTFSIINTVKKSQHFRRNVFHSQVITTKAKQCCDWLTDKSWHCNHVCPDAINGTVTIFFTEHCHQVGSTLLALEVPGSNLTLKTSYSV